jgi:hypothetical protein
MGSGVALPPRAIMHIVGTLILAAFFGVECRDTKPSTYGTHFTSWSWTLFLLTMAVATPCVVETLSWVPFVIVFLFWTWGTVFEVLIVLSTMVFRDEHVLLKYGNFSFIYVGDKLLHTLPCFVMFAFVAIHIIPIKAAMEFIKTHKMKIKIRRKTWYVPIKHGAYAWFFISPLAFIGIYAATHGLMNEYGSSMPIWEGFIVAAITVMVAHGILFLMLSINRNRNTGGDGVITAGRKQGL